MNDQILIQGLDLPVLIGVPQEERAAWQTLKADVCMKLDVGFETMGDDLSMTVDYAAVAAGLRQIAAARPRQLLETLIAELVEYCMDHLKVVEVDMTLRKKILPGTDYVAVRMQRKQNPKP